MQLRAEGVGNIQSFPSARARYAVPAMSVHMIIFVQVLQAAQNSVSK